MPQNNENQKVAIYTRVSTHHQIDKESLDFQKEKLTNYSEVILGIDDYEVFSDAGYSGKNTRRPDYQKMMNRIENGDFSHLLVWKIDRISRNLLDFTEMYEDLKEYDVTFVSQNEQFDTSTAMGEAMLKIILVFAELERNLASERVTSIMINRAQKGLWNGAPTPLGYDYDEDTQKLTINEEEAERIEFIFDQYEKRGSTSDVKHQLEETGIKTKAGNSSWTTKTISQILRNPIYKGYYRYNYKESGRGKIKDEEEWVMVEDAFPAIVSEKQFDKVNKMLDENYKGQRSKRQSSNHTHVFSGIMECPLCDKTFVASPGRERDSGFRPSAYRCLNYSSAKYSNCPHNNMISETNLGPFILSYLSNLVEAKKKIRKGISKDEVEEILISGKYFRDVAGIKTESLNNTYNIIKKKNKGIFEIDNSDNEKSDAKMKQLKKQRKKHERALERLKDLYLYSEESMPKKEYLTERKKLQDKIEEYERKMFEQRSEKQTPKADMSFIRKASRFLLAKEIKGDGIGYKKLAINNKQLIKDFVQSVIRKIIVDDRKVQKIRFINGLEHEFLWEEGSKGLKGRY